MWAREQRGADGIRPGQKESTRWIEGYERIAEMAAQMPQTRLVYLADREADMVAMMRRASELGTPADWLVRAKHNRCLPGEDGEKLWDHTTSGEALGEIAFTMPTRGTQKARPVRQQLWARGRDCRWQGRTYWRYLCCGPRNWCARRRQATRMAPVDEPRGHHVRRRHRTDRVVSSALGN